MNKNGYDITQYTYLYLLNIINELPIEIEIDLNDEMDLNNEILYANYMFPYDNQTALQFIVNNYELALDCQSLILLDDPEYKVLNTPIPLLEVMVSTTINELLSPEHINKTLKKIENHNPNCKTIKLTPSVKRFLIGQLHQEYHNMTGEKPIYG